MAGLIVVAAGYHAAFFTLALIATAGGLFYAAAMPETAPARRSLIPAKF